MKQKTFARVLAVLLAMCLFLTACTANTQTEDVKDTPQDNSATVENTDNTEATTDEQKPYWQMLNEVADSSELPDWDGETLDVTIWVAGGSDAVLGTIPETNVTFKELERVTGIKFNVEESYGNGGEGVDAKLAKIIASKDYPTLVNAWGADAQLRELFDHGYLVDLTEYYDNGDLWGVEYWMPREYAKDTLYSGMCTEDGRYYLIPYSFDASVLYENSDYVVKEFDPEYFDRYGTTPTSAGGFGSSQMVWVRDDILTALYPDALTLDEIQELYLENGTFTKEQIFDTGLETTEDFYGFLRAIQGELANGEYVGLDGKAMEVTYGPNSETDNWDLLNMLPASVLGQGANNNYFTSIIKDDDASTPIFINAYEDEVFVDFLRNINELVNEDVISANSFIDNSATFKEKVANAHYAVVYGNSARSSLPQESEYESMVDWGYRPVYLSQKIDPTRGGISAGGTSSGSMSIFRGDMTDEQVEQLVHAISYMASPVGKKCFVWGPASAGLFTEDENGHRTFTDAAVEANVIYGEDNEAAYNYGLLDSTCSTQQDFIRYSVVPFAELGGKQLMRAKYEAAATMDRLKADATKYYNPGIFSEYSYKDNTDYVTTAVEIYSFGVSNIESISEWWQGRPGFEKQLTKVVVSDPANFDAELAKLAEYSKSVGLTDEAMKALNDAFIEANKTRLDAAGIAY